MSGDIGVRPPARLSVLLLGTLLATSVGLIWAVPHESERDRSRIAAAVNDRAIEAAGRRAAGALQLAARYGDPELAAEIARELVSTDPAIDGLRVRFAGGASLEEGHLEEEGQSRSTRAIAGSDAGAELLWLGEWPLGRTAPSERELGEVEVFSHDPAGALALAAKQGASASTVWLVLLAGLALALVATLYVRARLAALSGLVSRIASGELEEPPPLRGHDEIAWIAQTLGEIRFLIREQVQRVQGRNATLLAHVVVQGDRLERLARFAAGLIAPMSDEDAFDEVIARLADELDATICGLLVPGDRGEGYAWLALRGLEASLDLPDPALASALARVREREEPVEGDPLLPEHPWMRRHGRQIPLRGVTLLALRFRGREQGILYVARRRPVAASDLEFLVDASRPLSIALANRDAYLAAVELSRALEERNEVLIAQRDQLRVVNRLRAEFTANMSHELRTPLNAILGYAELLDDELYGPVSDAQREALMGIDQAGRSLLTLVNQVLDLSSAEVGQLAVDFEPCDLAEVVREALAIARPLARHRPYPLIAVAPSHRLVTDPRRVLQILTNLLGNAIKFTSDGRVELRMRALADGGAEISVIDSGIGIADADLDLVFEDFRQVDQSSTRAHDGVGLGLAISRRLASLIGGRLAATSELGEGSIFVLTLPPRPPQESAGPPTTISPVETSGQDHQAAA